MIKKMFQNWQLPHYTFIFGVVATLIGLSAAYVQFQKEIDEAKDSKEQNRQREEQFKALLLKYEKLQEASGNIMEKANENLKIQKDINEKQDSALSIAMEQIKFSDKLQNEQSKLIELQNSNFRELAGSGVIPSVKYRIIDVLDKEFYQLEISLINNDTLTLRNVQISIKQSENYIPGSLEWSAQSKSGNNSFSYERYLEESIPQNMRSLDVPPLSTTKVNSSTIKFIKNLQRQTDIYITWKGGTLQGQITTRVEDFIPIYLLNHVDVRLHTQETVDGRKYIIYSSGIPNTEFHKTKMRERLLL